MKIALITSQTTFMPDNYNPFIEQALKLSKGRISHLIINKNNSVKLTIMGLGLYIIGAKNIGLSLFKNSLSHPLNRRKKIAQNHGVTYCEFSNLNDQEFINYIKKEKIDLIINARTRSIYKENLLKAPTNGCINIHHGLLPEQRGTLCDLWAMLNGDDIGFSVHNMTKKLDDGSILMTKIVSKNNSLKNYYDYQILSMKDEARAISDIVLDEKLIQTLSKGAENNSVKAHYYKTPNFKEIKMILDKGITL